MSLADDKVLDAFIEKRLRGWLWLWLPVYALFALSSEVIDQLRSRAKDE